jgi:hypothetical protein
MVRERLARAVVPRAGPGGHAAGEAQDLVARLAEEPGSASAPDPVLAADEERLPLRGDRGESGRDPVDREERGARDVAQLHELARSPHVEDAHRAGGSKARGLFGLDAAERGVGLVFHVSAAANCRLFWAR